MPMIKQDHWVDTKMRIKWSIGHEELYYVTCYYMLASQVASEVLCIFCEMCIQCTQTKMFNVRLQFLFCEATVIAFVPV